MTLQLGYAQEHTCIYIPPHGCLQTMKDFFLLGRGELFLAFVDLADSFMKQPPTRTTEHGITLL